MSTIRQPFKSYFKINALTLFLSVLLIILGALVHNTGSSLACPDWPLCFGQVFPKMEGGVLIEHSHRLLASTVGLLVIVLIFLSNRSTDIFKGSLFALALVIFQGVLGGLTVIFKISPILSTLHLATSQAFVALLLWLAMRSRPGRKQENHKSQWNNESKKISTRILLAAVFVFFQIAIGAMIRHGGAGVACGVGPEASLLCLDQVSGEATFLPTGLAAKFNLFHRILGLLVVITSIWGTLPLLKWARLNKKTKLYFFSLSPHLLVTLQVTIGIWSVSSGIAVLPVTLHLLFACLLWLNLAGLYFLSIELFKESHYRATINLDNKVNPT